MRNKTWIKEIILIAISIVPAFYVLWKKVSLSTGIVVQWEGDLNPSNYSTLGKIITVPPVVCLITFIFSKFNVKRGGGDVYYVRLFLAIILTVSTMIIFRVNKI